MSTLKALRIRKASVQATQKITMAMKMVAAAKLRKAQEELEQGRPYAHLMRKILQGLAERVTVLEEPQPLLTGTGKNDTHLIVIATSDRGLCGAFNSSILRYSRQYIKNILEKGQSIKLFCIGRRGRLLLEKDYKPFLLETGLESPSSRFSFSDAQMIAKILIRLFEEGQFDSCTLIYNQFQSALRQEVKAQKIIPLETEKDLSIQPIYEYEPQESTLLKTLLKKNIAVQIYSALSENAASEEGSRMTAMENASRNAEDMIRALTLTYNRTRQSHITRELIEIISGAEAL